jgi:RHS repeat-associated protein
MKQSGAWFYYLADGLGSTMAIVNATGTVQNSYAYDVYGKPTVTGPLSNEFDFAGRQTDATGLQYLRARYMDPETGMPSWTGSPTGYAAANPAMLVNPSRRYPGESQGRAPEADLSSGALFVAGGVALCVAAALSTVFPRFHRAFIWVNQRRSEEDAEQYRKLVVVACAILGPALIGIGIAKQVWFQ